jgi:hypothetical protein
MLTPLLRHGTVRYCQWGEGIGQSAVSRTIAFYRGMVRLEWHEELNRFRHRSSSLRGRDNVRGSEISPVWLM